MNWPILKINRFCKTGSGGTPSTTKKDIYYGGDIPWVKSGELKDDVLLSTEETLTDIGLAESAAKWIPAGSVLIAMYGATIGKTALLGIDATTNQAVCNVIPNPQFAVSRYVWYALRYSVPQLIAKRVGGAQPNISQKIISQFSLPIPALSEQRRIVEILDQADALRKKRAEADVKAARILPTLFYKMFGDPTTNPKGWPVKRIGEVCRVVSGATPRTNQPGYWGGGIPWATPKDLSVLKGWILERTERTLTDEGLASCSATIMPEKAVLLSSRAPIGLVAIAGTRMCTNQGFKNLVCGDAINHWYLFAWCKLRSAYLQSLGRGATFTEVSKQIVESILLPIPTMKMQQEFSDHILYLQTIYAQQRQVLDQLEITFQTLLHRAFTGGLTAKWREAHMKDTLEEMEEQTKASWKSNPQKSHTAVKERQ